MPKVKIPRKSTSIDMTAMCDVAFLLLTFFMLTTKFKPDEPLIVDTPASISKVKLPEKGILQVSIGKEMADGAKYNKVFFGIDGQKVRVDMLDRMAAKHKLAFTPQEKATFSLVSTFGVRVDQLKQYLDMTSDQRDKLKQPGIPIDSTNNELGDWILYARQARQAAGEKEGFSIAVKGDQQASYPTAKRVFDILQEQKLNKFNFITSMKEEPKI